jgi:opacity protein-like surface antigen
MGLSAGLGVRPSFIGMAFCIAALLPLSARAADIEQPLQYPPPTLPPTAPAQYKPPEAWPRRVCYAGAMIDTVNSHPTFYNVPINGVDQDAFGDGVRGGVLAGCDTFFASHTFLGFDTMAVYGAAKGSHLGYSFNLPYEWDTRLRLGYMLDDQWSVYIAGGAEDMYRQTTSPVGVVDNAFDWGGQVAVGFEYQFLMNWRFRGEYAFTWPGLAGISFPGAPNAQWAPSENLVRLSIMYTFPHF